MKRNARVFLLLLATLAVGLTGIAQAPTSVAQSSGSADTEEVAELIMESTDLTKAEAMRLIVLDPRVQELRQRLEAKYPNRVAGIWADVEDHGRIKVAMAGGAPMPGDIKEGFPQPELIDEIRALHATSTLEELKQRIENDGLQFRARGFELVSVSIDAAENRVRVGAVDAERVRQELEKHYPADQLEVVEEAPVRPAVCYDRTNCEPWRGGIEVRDIPVEASCSTAFSVTMLGSAYTSPLGYQYEGLLTAGHCFGLNDSIEHNGDFIGNIEYDQFAGSVDGATIVHDVGFVDLSDIGPVIFKQSTDMWFPITADASLSDGQVGTPVCHAAITRGYRCGTITDESYSFWYGLTRFTDFRRDNICTLPGDSGGAVFHSSKAHGIINFSNFEGGSSNPTCAADPRTTYSQIYYVERDGNVSVQHSS